MSAKNPFGVRLRIFLIIFAAILILGTISFMAIEDRSLTDSLYFIIVTMATVGYGDVHPVTPLGKLFTVILIILGVGTFLGVIANVTEMMLSKREKQVRMEKLKMVIGVFFSEVGTQLIKDFADYDPNFDEVRKGHLCAFSGRDSEIDEQLLLFHDRLRFFHHLVIESDQLRFEFLGRLNDQGVHAPDSCSYRKIGGLLSRLLIQYDKGNILYPEQFRLYFMRQLFRASSASNRRHDLNEHGIGHDGDIPTR